MKRFLPVLTFLAIAAVGLAMAGFTFLARQEASRLRFQSVVDSGYNRIESTIFLNLAVLRSARAFFQAQDGEVSRQEFRAFFDGLEIDANFDGLRGIGYLGLFDAGETGRIREYLQVEHGIDRDLRPETGDTLLAPVLLFEPLQSYEGIGYDMLSEPMRREAILAAMGDSGPHVSGKILLGEHSGLDSNTPGFLVFLRVDAPSHAGEASTGPAGILFATFRANELYQRALARNPLLPLALEIYDGHVNPDRMLFRSAAPPADPGDDGVLVIRSMQVGDREWILLFRPSTSFDLPTLHGDLLSLIAFSLLLAAAMALAVRYRERAYATAAALHESAERSLQEKDLMLQEMKHRNKNQIARILAIARQTASGSASLEDFTASFSARLQSMASALDLLTRSRWQKADLGELLRNELSQVFGEDLPEDLLAGPQVLLNEKATQTLGLAVHELATNALKYGKAGDAVDMLKVRWSIERQDGRQILVLNWRESGLDRLAPPAASGFGTRLIDMGVRDELKGSIERTYHPNGLEVEIRFPL